MPVVTTPREVLPSSRTHVSLSASVSLFEGGCIRLNQAKPSKPIQRLWFGIYRGKVTLFVGETGAGKSSVFRLISLHAALDKPLWGESFGLERPMRVLYVDPENMGDAKDNDGGLTAERMDTLGLGRPENLFLHSGSLSNGEVLNLSNSEHMDGLASFVEKHSIDLVILDPYAVVFQVKNENDNPEATQNMVALKQLARRTNAAVVLCHHTGKIGEEHSANAKYGRGASGILAAADVGVLFRSRAAQVTCESDEERRANSQGRNNYSSMTINKNRVGYDHGEIDLQMIGQGHFRLVPFAEYIKAGNPGGREAKREGQEADARSIFAGLTSDLNERDKKELIGATSAKKISESNAVTVLKQMVADGELLERRAGHGKYLYRKQQGNPFIVDSTATNDVPAFMENRHPMPKEVCGGD